MNYLGTEIPDDVYEYLKNDDYIRKYDFISSMVSKYVGCADSIVSDNNPLIISKMLMGITMEIREVCTKINFKSRIYKYIDFIENTSISSDIYLNYFHLLRKFSEAYYGFNPCGISMKLHDIFTIFKYFNIPLPDNELFIDTKFLYFKLNEKSKEDILKYIRSIRGDESNDDCRFSLYLNFEILHFVMYKYLDNLLFNKSMKIKNRNYLKIIKSIREILPYEDSDIIPYLEDINIIINFKEDM